jgi:hypothetical protein
MTCATCLLGQNLLGLIPYAVSVVPGIWLVKWTLGLNPVVKANRALIAEHLPLSGWIGVFERWIAIFLILDHHAEAIAFLVAAKGLLRLPDLKPVSGGGNGSSLMSSYILLGTLVSIVMALMIATLWGVVRPPVCG